MSWLKHRLQGARGHMGAMNTEAPADPNQLAAEALVNRGIWRIAEDLPERGRADLEEALTLWPDHLEALAQLALVLANQLGDRAAAGKTLSRLMRAMGPGDARRVEIQAALDALAVS